MTFPREAEPVWGFSPCRFQKVLFTRYILTSLTHNFNIDDKLIFMAYEQPHVYRNFKITWRIKLWDILQYHAYQELVDWGVRSWSYGPCGHTHLWNHCMLDIQCVGWFCFQPSFLPLRSWWLAPTLSLYELFLCLSVKVAGDVLDTWNKTTCSPGACGIKLLPEKTLVILTGVFCLW